jgi:hypothetical protein
MMIPSEDRCVTPGGSVWESYMVAVDNILLFLPFISQFRQQKPFESSSNAQLIVFPPMIEKLLRRE